MTASRRRTGRFWKSCGAYPNGFFTAPLTNCFPARWTPKPGPWPGSGSNRRIGGKDSSSTQSEQEEAKLKQMLAETDDDSDDIREAKATMGLFATERYFTEKAPATKKPRKGWRRLKYAAVFALGVLLDLFLDIDNPYNTKR